MAEQRTLTALGGLPGLKQLAARSLRGADKRKKPRLGINEINRRGAAAIREKRPDVVRAPDRRGTLEKVLDWVDLPRNAVANAIAGAIGMATGKGVRAPSTAALGMRRIYMSDILNRLGVKPGPVRSVVGFIGDIAIDPLTYLTAGAVTGLKVGAHVPRILRPGTKALRLAAKGKLAAKKAAQLSKALGVRNINRAALRLAQKHGAKRAAKMLMGRRGGMLTTRLAARVGPGKAGPAARAWFQQYGLKGRALLRIPFTGIKGPTLPWGKKAAVYRGMDISTKEGRRWLQRIKRTNDITRLASAIRRIEAQLKPIRALREGATEAGKRIPPHLVKEFAARERQIRLAKAALYPRMRRLVKAAGLPMKGARVGEATTKAGTLRTGLLHSEEAPQMLQRLSQAQVGKRIRQPGTRAALQRLFGPGRSELRQQELGIIHRLGLGQSAIGQRVLNQWVPRVDAAANAVAARQGRKPAEIRRLIWHIADIGGEEGVKRFHPGDYAHRFLPDQLAKLSAEPEVASVLREFRQLMGGYLKAERGRGIPTRQISQYVSRQPSKWAQPHFTEAEVLKGGASRRAPQMTPRARLLEVKDAAGTVVATELNTNLQPGPNKTFVPRVRETALDWAKRGWQADPTRDWEISAIQMERMARKGRLTTALGRQFQAKVAAARRPLWKEDIAQSAANRAAQHQRAMTGADLYDLAKGLGAQISDSDIMTRPEFAGFMRPNLKKIGPQHALRSVLGGGRVEEIYGMAHPRPVAQMLDRFADVWGGESMNVLLRATDHLLGWFKRWALFHPGYVARNIFQNSFGTLMAGGNPVKQARWAMSPTSTLIRKAVEEGTPEILRGRYAMLQGRKIPLSVLAHEASLMNFAGAARSTAIIQPTLLRGPGAASRMTRGLAQRAGSLGDLVRKANGVVETQMRLGTWLQFIDGGMAPRQAAMHTLLAMPDLSDITRFEKSVVARLWPWYRWMKKNGSLQLFYYLPQQPAWMAGVSKFQSFVEGVSPIWRGEVDVVPQELRPRWMREQRAAQIAGGGQEGSAFLLRSWFPFEEAQAAMSAPIDLGQPSRWLLSGMRPGVKFGVEMATQRDIWRERTLPKFTMQEMLARAPKAFLGASGTPLDNLLALRPLREYGRRVWEQPTAGQAALRGVLGGAVQPLSAERGLKERAWESGRELGQLRRRLNRAIENRDTVETNSLLRRYFQVLRERQRLGLQIPRAATRFLEEEGLTAGRTHPSVNLSQ